MTKERAMEIIKELEITPSLDRCEIDEIITDKNLDNEIEVHSGASKICITFLKADFVIKWAKGREYQKNKEANEALREVEVYKKSKKERLEMFFPYTESIGKINEVSFVLQKKIDFSVAEIDFRKEQKYHNIAKTTSLKMIKKMEKGFQIKKSCYNRYLDSLWAGMALTLYGKAVCKRLCDFIQKNQINDLHSHNIGYKDDKPVILDFSGYFR